MENKELNEQLEGLKSDLEGKSKAEIKSAIEAYEVKNNEAIELMKKEQKDSFDAELAKVKKELEEKAASDIKAVQDHADKLDVKLKEQKSGKKASEEDSIKSLVRDNFEEIKSVDGTKGVKLEVKDMTLGNALTGDQPRTYNFDVVRRRPQIVNVSDLVGSVPISGGTYTFVRSTLASGTVGSQTEGALKNQLEYDYEMVDANTNFIAGFSVYSKKMRNNLPFLESTLSADLRDDYARGENAVFEPILAAAATASTQIITGKNKVEMLVGELADLAAINTNATAIVLTPADYYDILITEKSTGAGYGLPGIVTFDNGTLRINGVAIVMAATWLPANKYYVGNWERVKKIVTEGFSLAFAEEDVDNFRKNNITARVEAQVTLTVERPSDLVLGDFTAV